MRIAIFDHREVLRVQTGMLVLANAEPLPFAACVWAASFKVPMLAKVAGLQVNTRGQIVLDPHLRSLSHPKVFAIGDAAIPAHLPLRMGCATAMPMAACAADNLFALTQGRALVAFRYAYVAQFISLGRRDALAQWVHHDDRPRRWILGGRIAAWLKNLTFRMNLFALRSGIYPWRLLGALTLGREMGSARARSRRSAAEKRSC